MQVNLYDLLKEQTLWINIVAGVMLINLFTNGRYKINYINPVAWLFIYCLGYVLNIVGKIWCSMLYKYSGFIESLQKVDSTEFLFVISLCVFLLVIFLNWILEKFKKHNRYKKYFQTIILYSFLFIIFWGGIYFKVPPFSSITNEPDKNIILQYFSILLSIFSVVLFLHKYSQSIYLDNFFIRTNIATRVDDSIYNKIKNHQWAQSEQEQIIKIKTYNDIIYSGVLLDEDMNNYFLSMGNVEDEKNDINKNYEKKYVKVIRKRDVCTIDYIHTSYIKQEHDV